MPEQDREQLVEEATRIAVKHDIIGYTGFREEIMPALIEALSILPPTTSAGELEICPNCSGSGVGIADTTCTRCDGCGGVRPSAGDGELVKRLRKAGRFDRACNSSNSATVTGSVVVSLYDEAADHIEALTSRVKEQEEALTWLRSRKSIHAGGVSVPGSALKAIADCIGRRARSALNPSPTEQEIQS